MDAETVSTGWVLKQKGMPLYFTGELVEWRGPNGVRMNVAEFSMNRGKAQLCSDMAAAEAVAFLFGITGVVEAVPA